MRERVHGGYGIWDSNEMKERLDRENGFGVVVW